METYGFDFRPHLNKYIKFMFRRHSKIVKKKYDIYKKLNLVFCDEIRDKIYSYVVVEDEIEYLEDIHKFKNTYNNYFYHYKYEFMLNVNFFTV